MADGIPAESDNDETYAGTDSDADKRGRSSHSRRAIRGTLVLVALVNLSWSLYQLPLIRVVESRLCHDHYAATDPSVIPPHARVPEELCKIDSVQQALSRIQRVMETSWVAGGECTALGLPDPT